VSLGVVAKSMAFVDAIYEGPSKSGKSKVFRLVVHDTGATLGFLKWTGRWRCYAFYPNAETLYEKRCLRDIADFCEEESRAQLVRARAVKKVSA